MTLGLKSLWSFEKCGISNAHDSTEDDALFDVSDSSSSDENDEDFSGFEDDEDFSGYEDDESKVFSYFHIVFWVMFKCSGRLLL